MTKTSNLLPQFNAENSQISKNSLSGKKVIVVGAGIGGLSAALFARKSGAEVQVFEKNAIPGGKASVRRQNGFVFDEGPSILVLKHLYEKFFADLGEKLENWIEFEALDPAFVVHGAQGAGSFTIHKNFDQTLESVRNGLGESAAKELKTFMFTLDSFAEKLGDAYANKLFHKVSDFLGKELISSGVHVSPFSSYKDFLFQAIKNPVLREFFLGFPGYAGLHPSKSAASLLLLPWSIFKEGVFYPKGGIYSIPKALHELALKMGVTFEFNSTLVNAKSQEVSSGGKKPQGLKIFQGLGKFAGNQKTSICELEFQGPEGLKKIAILEKEHVIFNGCLGHLAAHVFPQIASSPKEHSDFLTQSPSFMTLQCSAKITSTSVQAEVNSLAHHNLLLTGLVDVAYQDYFNTSDPLPIPAPLYVNIPSFSDKNCAPDGYHNVFVVVSVPSLTPEKMAQSALVDAEELEFTNWCLKTMNERWPQLVVEVMKVRSRRDFQTDFLQRGGQIYGPNLDFVSGPLGKVRRSPVFSHLKNFLLVGGSTQPGAGVPMALQSGKLVGELAAKS